jgi:acetyltransferase-like isoleucine patch superfamily enzyme
VIGAGAVVTKNITEPGVYVGNPAKFLKPLNK